MTQKTQRSIRRHVPGPDIFLLLWIGLKRPWWQQWAVSTSSSGVQNVGCHQELKQKSTGRNISLLIRHNMPVGEIIIPGRFLCPLFYILLLYVHYLLKGRMAFKSFGLSESIPQRLNISCLEFSVFTPSERQSSFTWNHSGVF